MRADVEPSATRYERNGDATPVLPLRVRGVCFEAGGKRLIEDISFTVHAGARLMILGPNGAGKSLLLRLCHGLLPPSEGSIEWAEADPVRVRHQQAMVFQRPVLLRRSVASNAHFGLRLRGVPRRRRQAVVADALRQGGLAHVANRAARVLSGGEQQRLALVRAWTLQPQVLFLDEPTAHLDPAATRAVETLLEQFHAAGTKLIMTTHDLGQARRLADEVLFLHRGRLLEHSAAAAFFTQPQSVEAAAFLDGNLLW
jgi:tungstate transport system ATP-binding protein